VPGSRVYSDHNRLLVNSPRYADLRNLT
jgi:hypothetical protein